MRRLLLDENGNPIPVMPLGTSQDVDGSAASAQSEAIDGDIARIVAVDADIRFEVGSNPEAIATSHFLSQGAEIWIPISKGHKIAVLGGVANIGTVA